MLRTKLGASAAHVYAARALKSCAGYEIYTQVWVGYLLDKRATDALPAANHAISMDIGTGTALSGSISTVLTVLSWICVGTHSRRALPTPVCA